MLLVTSAFAFIAAVISYNHGEYGLAMICGAFAVAFVWGAVRES